VTRLLAAATVAVAFLAPAAAQACDLKTCPGTKVVCEQFDCRGICYEIEYEWRCFPG